MLPLRNAVADRSAWSFLTLFFTNRQQRISRRAGAPEARPGFAQLFAGLCLLILALGANPALAVGGPSLLCDPEQSFTVASGGTHVIDLSGCSGDFGLIENNPGALHGTITGLANNIDGIAHYTNDGLGDLSDSFTLLDSDSGEVHFTVTVLPASAAITVTPASLPAPVIGAPYSQSMASSGGVGPYTYVLDSGTLPPGITVSSGGVISGTANATGSFVFAVKVTDSTAGTPLTVTKNYSATVAIPTLSITPTTLTAGGLSTAYSQQMSTANGSAPYTYVVESGTLPPGLSQSGSGLISGTPSSLGTYNFVIKSTDVTAGNGPYNTSRSYSLVINAQAPPTITSVSPASGPSTGGTAVTITGTGFSDVTALKFGNNNGVAVTVVNSTTMTATSPAGSVGTVNVVVTASSGTSATDAANQFTYTAAPPTAGNVSATLAYGSSANPITLNLSGGTATSVAVASAASHGTATASGTSITYTPTAGYGGPDSFTYTATNGAGTSAPAIVTITVGTPTIAIAPSTVPAATVGTAYSQSVTATNGMAPYTYTISAGALPAGLSLNASTGALSGTPTAGGVFTFTVRATDSSTGSGPYSGARAYSMTVAAPTVAIAPTTLPAMTVGTSYSQSITASGGTAPYSYAITAGSLPAGLSLDTSTGTLSGTPTVAAMYSFTVTATDSSTGGPFTGARAYSGTVAAAAVPVVTAISPTSGSTTGGTTVTITGTGFVGTTAVRFGATAATGFTVNGATQITAIAPAGAGTIDVRVTTASGTSATSVADQFTYIDTPTVSSLSPSVGHASGGSTVVITGSGFSGATAVTFGATAATGFTVNSATQITATSPAGTGTVDIRVTTAGGTSATTAADQFTFTEFAVGAVSQPVAYGSSSNAIALYFMGGLPTSVTVASNPAHGSATASGTAISYTPAAGFAGADSFTYTATKDGITSSPATVSITVSPPTQTVTPAASWTATRGVFYTQTLTWSGGTAPYSNYSVSGLPSGLSLSNPTATSVVISGTPSQAGNFSVATSARDSSTGDGPFTHHETFTLIVSTASPLAVTPGATTFNATSGTAFSQTFTASGGLAPYTFTQNGTLPAGVTWNAATATLTGEPTASGDFPFSITASDSSAGAPATLAQSYLLKVAHEIPVAPAQSVNSAGPGQPVEINLTSGATGGPFTAANLISVTPANAGSASIRAAGAGYVLRFVPNPDASGVASLSYTLSNAGSTSSPGVISIALSARSDPTKDAEVQGLLSAQASSSRRFANGQISNFQQRLEALHTGNVSSFSNGFTLTAANLQQRHRRDANDDPTGIEQWLQIQSAKLQDESPLRATPAREQTPALGNQPSNGPTSPLAIWTSGSISIGDDANGSSEHDQEFVTSGLTVGADYRWTPDLTVGMGFGYGHDKTDIGDNGSRSQADSYSLSVYGSYRPTQNTYLDAVLGYQRLSFDNRRYVTDNGGRVNGDRDGDQIFASLAAGYEYRQEQWLLSPYARLDLAHATLDSYSESGDDLFALSYEQQTVKTTSTSLGLRSEYAQTTAIGEFTPSLRLEYQHDFQGSGDATMRYSESNATRYHSNLEALGQDRGVLGLGLGLLTESSLSLRMEYQFTISSGDQQAQTVLFNLEKPF